MSISASRSRYALLALLLSVPITSFGAIMMFLVAPGAVGKTILGICQVWLLILPWVWLRLVERRSIQTPPPNRRDWVSGLLIGLLMFGLILLTYESVLKYWIDPIAIRNKLQQVTELTQSTFLLSGIYFTFGNALIEEYVWRWFVYRRCEELAPVRVAIPLSALFFTVHHTIGLAVFTDWKVVLVGSLAVFGAGVIWSTYYYRYRSVWSPYFSHAIADIALHIVAWRIFFG
jgi:uncharacterized protein